jgi:hypothetical protein
MFSVELFSAGGLFLLLGQCSKGISHARVTSSGFLSETMLRIGCVAHSKDCYQREGTRSHLMFACLTALVCSIILSNAEA